MHAYATGLLSQEDGGINSSLLPTESLSCPISMDRSVRAAACTGR